MRLCKACSLKNINVQVPQLSTCWNILCSSKSCQFSLAWHEAAVYCFPETWLWRLPPPRYISAHVIHANTEITGLLLAPGCGLGCQPGSQTGKSQWKWEGCEHCCCCCCRGLYTASHVPGCAGAGAAKTWCGLHLQAHCTCITRRCYPLLKAVLEKQLINP